MNTKKVRDPGLDIIRSIALLCVICVHFFLNTNFYANTFSGFGMLVMTILRNSFMICVPLFLLLTGYLVNSKDASKAYYKKIIRILYVYLAASVVCGIYKTCFLPERQSLVYVIAHVLSFNTAPYSWYIEMYIGLFLLIPFLNTMYESLSAQRKKQLVATFLFLTVSPSIFNIYSMSGLDWWLMPSKASDYFPFVPDWWANIYPITYFFLGKYLREFPLKLTCRQIACWILPVFCFSGLFSFYRSYGSTFIWGIWQDYGSLFITLQALLVFCFFVNAKYENFPPLLSKAFSKVSELSLGAYLTSWVFDRIIYDKLNEAVSGPAQKLLFFPITVTLVLIGSLACSYLIDLSYSLIVKRQPKQSAAMDRPKAH